MTSLKKKAVLGVIWNGSQTALGQVLSWVGTIILVRLLTPEDFGVFGIVVIFNGFAQLLIDFGLGNALIRDQTSSDIDKNSIFWFNLSLGLLMTLCLFFSSSAISYFFKLPGIEIYIRVISFLFLINSIKTIQTALARKELEFRKIFIISTISQTASLTVAIILASYDYGVWSLVFQTLSASTISCFLYYYSSNWKPSFSFSRQSLLKYSDFSLNLVGNSTLNYWARNFDNFLIGKYLGPINLGYYTKAYGILMLPLRKISGTITNVFFPAFSKMQGNSKQLRHNYLNLLQIVSFLTFPGMIFLFLNAELFTLVVFGQQWVTIIPLIRIFSILGAVQSILTTTGIIFMTKNKMNIVFRFSLITKVGLMIFMIIGLQFGIEGVAYSVMIFSFLSGIPQMYLCGKQIDMKLKQVVSVLLPNIFALSITVFIYVFITELTSFEKNIYLEITYKSIVYSLIYLVFSKVLRLNSLETILRVIRNYKNEAIA